jgi:pilus assembly protein CpaF
VIDEIRKSSGAVAIIEKEVRELVRRRGIDPSSDETEISDLVDEAVSAYEERVETSTLPRIENRSALRKAVLDKVVGYGDLQPLLDDPLVEEVWINGPGRVFCARGGKHELTNVVVHNEDLQELVERMLRSSGRRLDLSSPFVDATMPDGSRLHVVIPAITRRHWAVNIRKFVLRAHSLNELIKLDSIERGPAEFLDKAVKAGLNIVVSGGTQSGKTTMLNCLASSIPGSQRVITCEEVFELRIALPDVVSMQTRQANLEGKGEIDLRRLIIEALRMRPDRLIVGEVRQHEAMDLLVALNSGLPGMTSVHANSAREALMKLTTLPLLAGENVTHSFVVPTVAASVDLIVHLASLHGRRRTTQVLGVTGRTEGKQIETISLWEQVGERLKWTGQQPPAQEKFAAAGLDPRIVDS